MHVCRQDMGAGGHGGRRVLASLELELQSVVICLPVWALGTKGRHFGKSRKYLSTEPSLRPRQSSHSGLGGWGLVLFFKTEFLYIALTVPDLTLDQAGHELKDPLTCYPRATLAKRYLSWTRHDKSL